MKKIIIIASVLFSIFIFSQEYKAGITEENRILASYTVMEVFAEVNRMAVACSYDGFMVYNISNRANPILVGYADTYRALDVCCDEKYVYVADYSGGFKIYDYTDNGEALLTGSITDSISEARRITVVGDYAYIAGGYKGLQIVDISDRYNPVYIGRYPISSGDARKVWVQDTIAYMATQYGGINIINISDKSSPFLISNIPCGSLNDDVCTDSIYLYAADGDSGIVIYNVNNPASPVLVDRFTSTYDPPNRLVKLYDRIYASAFGYLHIVDVSDKSDPITTGSLWVGNTIGIAVSNDGYIYSAEGGSGLGIYVTPETGIEENHSVLEAENQMSIYYLDSNIIMYLGAGNKDINISVIDKTGRILISLYTHSMAGENRIEIPAENVPAGEYFIVGNIDNSRIHKKFLIIK